MNAPEAPQEADHVLPDSSLPEWPPLRVVIGSGPTPRALPNEQAAEEAVVGTLLFSGGRFRAVAEVLQVDDFSHPVLQVIYAAMGELARRHEPIDLVTVAAQLRDNGTLHKLKPYGGEAYLADLAVKTASVDNVLHHAGMVRQVAVQRRLILSVSTLAQQAPQAQDVAAFAARAARQMAELQHAAAPRAIQFFDKAAFRAHALQSLARPIPPKLPFGLVALDEGLGGGFPAGGVVVLAAPPKHMKTGLLVEMICRWAKSDERIVYITGENTAQEIYGRLSAHEQWGTTYKFHGRIKHENDQAAANYAPIEWMAGRVRVVSLPDEEMEDPPGPSWIEVLRQCERQDGRAPMVIVDYVEEFADRLPRSEGLTDQQANKIVMRKLKDYACRHQARVLAVCSVGRGQYNGLESVFRDPEAKPEAFASVAKHSGYIDYAASALLALQFTDGEQTTDPESGRECVAMRLHLAFTREGPGPVTVPVLSFGGHCRFTEDTRVQNSWSEDAAVPGLRGQILRLLAKPEHEAGLTWETIRDIVSRRPATVKSTLRDMAKAGELTTRTGRRNAILFVHPRHGGGGGQEDLPEVLN